MLKIAAGMLATAMLSEAATAVWNKGCKVAGKLKEARDARRAPSVAENLNAAPGATSAILEPFRVEVTVRYPSGAVGCSVHDIYAQDADNALAWAQRMYDGVDSTRLTIIVRQGH